MSGSITLPQGGTLTLSELSLQFFWNGSTWVPVSATNPMPVTVATITPAPSLITGSFTGSGQASTGPIQFIGYNGRPRFNSDALISYQGSYQRWSRLKFVFQNNANGTLGVVNKISSGGMVQVDNCYIDQNGFDAVGVSAESIFNCRLTNSGTATAGTTSCAAILSSSYNGLFIGNFINGWRGDGIYNTGIITTILNTIVVNCKQNGIELFESYNNYGNQVIGCTINGNAGDGVRLNGANSIGNFAMVNSIVTGNGGYGLNCSVGTAALNNNLLGARVNFNNYGTGGTANTSGAYNNCSAGANDVALDPQFSNTGTKDYSVGANMKNIGTPGLFPGTITTSYVAIGAAQPIGGTSGMLFVPNMDGV